MICACGADDVALLRPGFKKGRFQMIDDSFALGLGHALKYAGKFLDRDPVRLARLEWAFHGVRRVHTLGAFYNALPKDNSATDAACDVVCPACGAAVLREDDVLCAVVLVHKEGRCDLDVLRGDLMRAKVFAVADG